MNLLNRLKPRLKPRFWVRDQDGFGPFGYLFNFPRMWKLAVFLTSAVVLVPLVTMALIDYRVTREAMEKENFLRTSRLTSNTRRTVSYFFGERRDVLEFIALNNTFEELNEPRRLRLILENLKASYGGFVDIGVIDPQGTQRTYVGPYPLKGKDYSGQSWYQAVLERGMYVSDVFLGFRNVPHMVIAVKRELPNGVSFVLRTTLDTKRFQEILSQVEVRGEGEVCIINRRGVVQKPGSCQCRLLESIQYTVPEYSSHTQVNERTLSGGERVLVGYAYIEETPFILTVVKRKQDLMEPWYQSRIQLIGFLVVSGVAILLVILGGATLLVNRIYQADQRRLAALHQLEHSSKMATVGRLSAGVAHEINNPLAIINEKAGLMRDYFILAGRYERDETLLNMVDAILRAVERGGTITRRLLSFARPEEGEYKAVELGQVVREVLEFLGKEAEYRSISITVDVSRDASPIVTDRGKLQEILLNLINNALEAMEEGGSLRIAARRESPGTVCIQVKDTGCGMTEAQLKNVFDPFFTTKGSSGGVGLGLSITYGLVQKLQGRVEVESTSGQGTTFHVHLPVDPGKEGGDYAGTAG